jgi:hypothetical protein
MSYHISIKLSKDPLNKPPFPKVETITVHVACIPV